MVIKLNILFVFILLVVSACKQSDPIEKKFNLVWSDEFNGSELDENKWDVQLGDGSDYGLWKWGNNEDQYYRRENVTVEDGLLKIKAVKEDFEGFEYTSARIRSLNKGDFKYGRFEASIRMDNTNGLWHAFWMLPSNPQEGWPVSGEIDIMEYVGNLPSLLLNYVHFADPQGNHRSIGSDNNISEADQSFHLYAIEWDQNQIKWFIDDIETFRVLRTNDAISATWPFDAKFHLLLNTAVGGNLGGQIDEDGMQTPRFMEVDYVRVYQ